MKKRFHVTVRRGCPRRSFDAAQIHEYLGQNKWQPSNMEKADVVIVYTCGGFKDSEDRSVKTIEKALKHSKEVIVTGCLTKINPKLIKTFKCKIVSPDNLSDLDRILKLKKEYNQIKKVYLIPEINDLVDELKLTKFLKGFSLDKNFLKKCMLHSKMYLNSIGNGAPGVLPKEVYNIMISRGCASTCSYCAIKMAMGNVRSRPLNKIIKEFHNGLKKGHKKFVLLGEDIGAYGTDNGSDICELLEKVLGFDRDYTVFLNDFNPKWLKNYNKKLFPILERHHEKIDRLLLPVQSGSDKVLKNMNREYKIEDVQPHIIHLKNKFPKLKIETHIMVGFPGETDRDFEASKQLLQICKFDYVNIYKYEERPMTKASRIYPKVPQKTIKIRAKKLMSIL